MSFSSSKASSSSNRKSEPNFSIDLKHKGQHTYGQSTTLTARSEKWSSREFYEQPHIPSYFDSSPSAFPSRAKSVPSMDTVNNATHIEQPLRKFSSPARKDSLLSSRSDPSLVASTSYAPQYCRSVSDIETHTPVPTIPPRSNTIPSLDSKYTISHTCSKSTSKLEPATHNRSTLSYVPDFPHLIAQQMPPPHSSRSTKHFPTRRRTSSGTVSEDRTVASVDMKRLLSKPALPSSAMVAASSAHSLLQSDSEFSSSGSHTGCSKGSPSRSKRLPDNVKPPKSIGRREPPLVLQDNGSPSAFSSVRAIGMSSSPQLSSSPEESLSSYRHIPSSLHDQRQAPVLKRRLSRGKSSSLSSPTKIIPTANIAGDRQTNSLLTVDPTLSRKSGARWKEVNKGTRSSSLLTPAGAVAEAYKQQERKRDYLSLHASGSGDDETQGVANWPFSDDDREQAIPAPHFTVFGAPTDCFVSVGGLSNRLLDGYRIDSRYVKPDTGTGHGLKRKVSARWKKANAGVRGDEFPPKIGDLEPGVQGRRSTSLPREKTKSLGRSMDLRSPNTYLPSESVPFIQHMFTPKVAVEEDVRTRPGKLIKTRGDRDREHDEEGGKIWKLMKRISTGGLRDKYGVDNPPPPVPPLPRDVRSDDEEFSGVLPQSPQLRALMSVAPTAHPQPSPPRTSPSHGVGSRNVSGSRPSMTTGYSPSPGSADFASSRYFHQPHSTESSSSSNCEDNPPILSTMIGQHIIPPNELYRMNLGYEKDIKPPKSHIPQRSTSLPIRDLLPPPDYWPEYTRPSLPYPPRRAATSGKETSPQQGTYSPLFSTKDAEDLFVPHAVQLESSSSLSPSSPLSHLPTIPRRQRLCSLSVSTHSALPPSTSMTTTPVSDGDHESHSETGKPDRKSLGAVSNASTARQHSNPSSPMCRSPTSATSKSPMRSPLNFRELGASPHTPLTAKEKAEIWNDLLERSDRAGGTLHIGGQDLISEHG